MRNKTFFAATLFALLAALPMISLAQETEPVVITLWHISVPADGFSAVLPVAIEKFNAEHTDIQFEAQAIGDEEFKTQLQIAASAGNQPDVFQTWGGGTLKSFVDAGVVAEIPQLEGDERFVSGALSPFVFEGKYYGVPMNLAASVLWVNQALFKDYDLELPTTWTNFITACQTLSQNGIIPMTFGNKDRWPGSHWIAYVVMRLGGPEAFLSAVNGEIPFNDPIFVEAGTRIQEAVNAGCFEAGMNGIGSDDSQVSMALGEAAMRQMGDWDLSGLREVNPDILKDITVMPFPVFEDGKGKATEMVGGTGQAFAISATAPEGTADAVIELLSSEYFGTLTAQNDFIPALVGYDDLIEDPIKQQIAALIANSTYIQLWWDQFLPPAMAQAHLDTTQQLFGLAITPEDAAQAIQDLAESELTPTEAK